MAADRRVIVPHRTRVVVPGRGAGMVIRVHNAYRRFLGGGIRIDVPAAVHVVLDDGGRVTVNVVDVELEEPSTS